jgi:AcrR family transcriptional regulator
MVNRFERKNRATVADIVRAAGELMAEGGVPAVTLEAISRRADVAIQTIYNRVGGRPAVLMTVAEHAFAANRSYLDAAYASPGSPVDRIRAVAAAYTRFALEQPHEYRLLAFPGPDAPALERLDALIREQNERLASLLREAVDQGIGRADLDPDLAATVLWRMWDGVLGLMFQPTGLRPDADDLPKILQILETIAELGLRVR